MGVQGSCEDPERLPHGILAFVLDALQVFFKLELFVIEVQKPIFDGSFVIFERHQTPIT